MAALPAGRLPSSRYQRYDSHCLHTRQFIKWKIVHWDYQNLDQRLNQHNSGKNKSTKHGRPYKVLYSEKCDGYTAAREREKWLKSGVGREFIKQQAGIV